MLALEQNIRLKTFISSTIYILESNLGNEEEENNRAPREKVESSRNAWPTELTDGYPTI